MDPAVTALVGVLLGGGITAGTNFRLEAVRAKREKRASEQRDRQDARRSARLIAEELEYGRRLLTSAQERGHYTWEPPRRVIPAAAWTEYRADFALAASDEEWTTVAAAFADFDRLNWHLIAVMDEEHWTNTGPQHPMDPRTLDPKANELIPAALEKVDAALALLRTLMAR
jgi:hypothetical protein